MVDATKGKRKKEAPDAAHEENETDAEERKEEAQKRCKAEVDDIDVEKTQIKATDDKKDDVEKAKDEEEEDLSDMNDEEKSLYSALKSKVKKIKKGEGSSLAPQESEARSATSEGTITPNLSTPSQAQNVFVPPSQASVNREQHTPMDGMHKSINNQDLVKSPLFLGISGQIEEMRKAMDAKLDAVAKSYNDRLDNMKKGLETTEQNLKKFYSQSFYKAADENVAPESTQALSIAKQLETGGVRFRNK